MREQNGLLQKLANRGASGLQQAVMQSPPSLQQDEHSLQGRIHSSPKPLQSTAAMFTKF